MYIILTYDVHRKRVAKVLKTLKKALFFDTINLETAKMLLLYLTYKELRRYSDGLTRIDITSVIPYL